MVSLDAHVVEDRAAGEGIARHVGDFVVIEVSG